MLAAAEYTAGESAGCCPMSCTALMLAMNQYRWKRASRLQCTLPSTAREAQRCGELIRRSRRQLRQGPLHNGRGGPAVPPSPMQPRLPHLHTASPMQRGCRLAPALKHLPAALASSRNITADSRVKISAYRLQLLCIGRSTLRRHIRRVLHPKAYGKARSALKALCSFVRCFKALQMPARATRGALPSV